MIVFLKEGLFYGIGDVVIGINFVDDLVESVKRLLYVIKSFMNDWEIFF